MPFQVSSSIVKIAEAGDKIPPHVFAEIVQNVMPPFWQTCTRLSNASRKEPDQIAHVDISRVDSNYPDMLEGLANSIIRRTVEETCSCRLFMQTPLRLNVYGKNLRIAEIPPEPIASVEEQFPDGFEFLQEFMTKRLPDGFGKTDISAEDYLIRYDIMTMMAVDPFRNALRHRWKAEFAFRSPSSFAFRDVNVISAEFAAFASIEEQVLSAPIASVTMM